MRVLQENGEDVARSTIAVNRTFKKDNEDQQTDFINLVAFKKQADFLEKFGKKGIKFIVTGRIQTGYYDKDGSCVHTTDAIVENLEFAESKNASSVSDPSDDGFTNIPDDGDYPFK